MEVSEGVERRVIFFIADISGYTRYIVSNEKALAHSQIIVKELMNTIMNEVQLPMQVIRLEGDAIFLYIDKDNPAIDWENTRHTLLDRLIAFFRVFAHKISELTLHKICNCNACNNVERLQLKIIAHSGNAIFYDINGLLELTGKDPIIVHRLLKNSVPSSEYVLMTKSAFKDLGLTENDVERSQESYDELGEIDTYIHYPPSPEPFVPDPEARYPNVFVETLRSEISREYSLVANNPEEGFHFHTGRRLSAMLNYEDSWLQDFPDWVIESFAGTGNVFSLGALKGGQNVIDMGCGAGLDSLIAARMVGPEGRVLGVDMTYDMVKKALKNSDEVGMKQVNFVHGYNENIPAPAAWADVIISNGSLNLSPDKDAVFDEMFRILKPGGHLQIADILVQKQVPESAKNNIDLWAG